MKSHNIKMPKVSVVVTTYNWPEALDRVLSALTKQEHPDFEIIVADDGSSESTKELIETYQRNAPHPIEHVWQPDEGFRAAAIRNRAIKKASGEFIIFIDGDSIPRPHFISRHLELAESGYFLSGNRVLLNQEFSQHILNTKLCIEDYPLSKWLLLRLTNKTNRFLSLLKAPDSQWRYHHKTSWKGAVTCNLSAWKDDLIKINGFDEDFTGWGLEDSDLVIRLINAGVFRKEGRYSTAVFHLWHPQAERTALETNNQLLEKSINNCVTKIPNGIYK